MSKSTAITIIVATLLLLSGGLAWWYFNLGDTVSTGSENGGGINFFPFGNNGGAEGENNGEVKENENKPENEQAPEIREVSNLPIAGFIPLTDNLGFALVRYVDQETGHVYDAPLEIVSKKRISNTTIPKVREVIWAPQGNSFIMRYLDEKESIQSFYATLKENLTGEGSLGGKFLPENISSLSLFNINNTSSLTKIIYSLIEGSNLSIFTAENDGSKPVRAYSTPLKDW